LIAEQQSATEILYGLAETKEYARQIE